MKLDLCQITTYELDLLRQIEIAAKAKCMAEHYRLQIKETKRMAPLAKKNEKLKAFIRLMPKDSVSVMPAPGSVYVTVSLSSREFIERRAGLDELGIEYRDSEKAFKGSISSPVIHLYKDGAFLYYITQRVV